MGRNHGKNITKNLGSKYSQKHIDHVKQSAADAFKTASKKAIDKKGEATGDLLGNKIVDKTTRVSKTLPQNNLEEEEIFRERYISPELTI